MSAAGHISLRFPSAAPALWGSLAAGVQLEAHLHKRSEAQRKGGGISALAGACWVSVLSPATGSPQGCGAEAASPLLEYPIWHLLTINPNYWE